MSWKEDVNLNLDEKVTAYKNLCAKYCPTSVIRMLTLRLRSKFQQGGQRLLEFKLRSSNL